MGDGANQPTIEQINQAYTDICAQVGVLDFEFRQLVARRAEIDGRLAQIEADKARFEQTVESLRNTKIEIEQQAAVGAAGLGNTQGDDDDVREQG